ncbi:MAG: 3-hydroxybutyryl-CoA dehydrogenase [Syntrophomonadaceae bacterium]|jgi:3-hydroxybutyryl-CoA dehydrogenase|nr:3-hydroxybutyryl-CoA dehydrogenase [Syntrophomonadaceae bacterium]
MDIKKVGVLGAGTMGAGIAQVCAESGFETVVVDIEEAILQKALAGIGKSWQKAVDKGKIDDAAKAAREKLISFSTEIASFKDCDLVIEAIAEQITIKQKVFKEMDGVCPSHTILATNTSALSITEIAAATSRADRIAGMHFFNPVTAMKLVEVVPGTATSEATKETIVTFTKSIKKEPVIAKETPGFIVNRILNSLIIEAAFAYQEGIASAEEIDKAMKLGAGLPMGPLALADLVGLDIALHVSEYFYNEFNDPKYRPPIVLKQKVRAGDLGVKTGKGFFDYSK